MGTTTRQTPSGVPREAVRPPSVRQHRRAFSLIEMLVVFAIIAALVGLLMTAVSASRRAGLRLRCISQMHQVAFEFRMFADDWTVKWRGDSEILGPGQFHIEDFKDYIYGVDEFWDAGPTARLTVDPTRQPMMCPAGPDLLYRQKQATAFQPTVFPERNISLALNRRLWRDGVVPGVTRVTSKILDHPNVPVVFDVDGEAAMAAVGESLYAAPLVKPGDDYWMGAYWQPAFRHGGSINVAFVGGHVASSKKPLEERSWAWGYIPER